MVDITTHDQAPCIGQNQHSRVERLTLTSVRLERDVLV
jgi:hypothetical protein